MTTKEKILKYLKIKEISQDKFSRDCGFSSGILRVGSGISSEKLINIRDKYPDLNINWLLFDEGNMIKVPKSDKYFSNYQESVVKESQAEYCSNCEALQKELKLTQELLESKNELIYLLKDQLKTELPVNKSKAS